MRVGSLASRSWMELRSREVSQRLQPWSPGQILSNPLQRSRARPGRYWYAGREDLNLSSSPHALRVTWLTSMTLDHAPVPRLLVEIAIW